MASIPVFLSVVFVVRNQSDQLEQILIDATECISTLVTDYEIVVVDNASKDDSVSVLRRLIEGRRFPNVQVYGLSREVDIDIATWAGLENALGDFVAVVDPLIDDIGFLPTMVDHAVRGTDVVFATNSIKPPQSIAYRIAYAMFNRFYRLFSGIDLAKEAPRYRVLSKRMINFVLQHPQPAITYRHLPAAGSFARVNLSYSAPLKTVRTVRVRDSIDRGMRLLVSTTRAPMRIVTSLSFFGAIANVIYSVYVVAVGIFKADVAPGWVSLSLQQSGMFFLISLVLLVLGEYILNMASLSNEGPLYHVGQEFVSERITRRERLNIEEPSGQQARHADGNSRRS